MWNCGDNTECKMESGLPNNHGEATEASGEVSVREAGARGGRATSERLGSDFFREIGRKGGQRTKELYGALFREYGRRGGRPRRPDLETMGEGPDKQKEGRSARGALPPPG